MTENNYQDLGMNLQKIVKRLMANDNLVNLLYYTDKDPLNHEKLSEEQKRDLIFEKLIKIVPRIGPKETAHSLVVIKVAKGIKIDSNTDFKNIKFDIEIFVPVTQWIIKDTNLRPFAIMSEIQKSLNNKSINGLGKIQGGDFELNYLTEELVNYEQFFWITSYD